LPLPEVPIEQTSALNWLINQAVVTCCNMPAPSGYQLFTPLFTEFLARRLEQSERTAAEEAGISAQGAKMPAAGEAPSEPGVDLDQFTKIEASLLRYFQSHQNETVSTEQLLADVWKRPDATNRRVQEAIRRLRLHLEAANPPIGAIENDRGRGYRFTPAGK
jgi:DNA-binding response OmpR family regulator